MSAPVIYRLLIRTHFGDGECSQWETYLTARKYRVGRLEENDIVIRNMTVSKNHCGLDIGEDGSIRLMACRTTNGTFLDDDPNPIKIQCMHPVNPSQIIRLGPEVDMIFVSPDDTIKVT